MSVGDVLSVVGFLVGVGKEIYDRCEAIKELDTNKDIPLLTMHLEILMQTFKGPEKVVILTNSSKFVGMLGILESIEKSYRKCAKAMGFDVSGTTSAMQKTARNSQSITRRLWLGARIPSILADIHSLAEQLQKISDMLAVSVLLDVRQHQVDTDGDRPLDSTAAKRTATPPDTLLDPKLCTGLTNIDRMIGNLMTECDTLKHQLEELHLLPDPSAIQDYQAQNPEGASFWKDRFQRGQIYASDLRYEVTSLATLPTLFFHLSLLRHMLIYFFLNRLSTFLGRVLYTK